MSSSSPSPGVAATPRPQTQFHIGPIISWPFFGSNRGDLLHPNEINRGPWSSTQEYLDSCVQREVTGVIRENEGKAAPHKLHLDPDEIISSRHHHLQAVPGDQSDDSDEWDLEESEAEWDGPGDAMYRDYRRMQRSTFLIAHLDQRVQRVKAEMQRWMALMTRLRSKVSKLGAEDGADELFGLDCHDLSLENVFVDDEDPTKIVCRVNMASLIGSDRVYRLASLTGNRLRRVRCGRVPIYQHFSSLVLLQQSSFAKSSSRCRNQPRLQLLRDLQALAHLRENGCTMRLLVHA